MIYYSLFILKFIIYFNFIFLPYKIKNKTYKKYDIKN